MSHTFDLRCPVHDRLAEGTGCPEPGCETEHGRSPHGYTWADECPTSCPQHGTAETEPE